MFTLIEGNLFSLIDIVFYMTMGTLILMLKKWELALAVVIYSGVFSVLTLMSGGVPGGWAFIIFGILAAVQLKKVTDAYHAYQRTGVLPQTPV